MEKQSPEQNYLNVDIYHIGYQFDDQFVKKLTIWLCKNNVWLMDANAFSPTLAQINLSLEEAQMEAQI